MVDAKTKLRILHEELLKIVEPRLLDDFCGYDEKQQGFNIVLAIKEIIEAKEQECEDLKKLLQKEI